MLTKKDSRKTVSSSICVYKEVKVNLHYRHSLQLKKKKKKKNAGSRDGIYAKNIVRVTLGVYELAQFWMKTNVLFMMNVLDRV